MAALLGAPGWLVRLSPLAHVALVPAELFRAGDAAAMLAVAALCAAVSAELFRRRDLTAA